MARIAATLGRPVYAVAGKITEEVREADLFRASAALDQTGLPMIVLMREAAALLTEATSRMLSATPPGSPSRGAAY